MKNPLAYGASSPVRSVPPPRTDEDYSPALAQIAARIAYRSPILSPSGLPVFILNAAAFPDAADADHDELLPYLLSRFPHEDELINGSGYEVIFFAGNTTSLADTASNGRKRRPGWSWFISAYQILSRAMRKQLQKLYIVHERSWVRILVEMFSTIVSPKFRRKIMHSK